MAKTRITIASAENQFQNCGAGAPKLSSKHYLVAPSELVTRINADVTVDSGIDSVTGTWDGVVVKLKARVMFNISGKLSYFPSRVTELGRDLNYLRHTSAPSALRRAFLKTNIRRGPLTSKYSESVKTFRDNARKGRFSNDWFSANIPYWQSAFERKGFYNKPINALEIGSWQGMSSLFILSSLPLARLTCVDTWEGADEHNDRDSVFFNGDISQGVQQDFDANLREYASRLTKYRGTSFSFFNRCNENFDLVYIDGSHLADDVVIDAVKGFECLNSGGILIFDDYLFKYYERPRDNPASAINWFLKQKAGLYRILSANWQVILEKVEANSAAGRPSGHR